MNPMIKNIALVVIVIVIALLVIRYGNSAPGGAKKQPIATVAFSCNAGMGISAVFYKGESRPAAGPDLPPTPGGSVDLTLSDGRTMTLQQTVSADGGRYANADESFVFWGKGNVVQVLENGQPKSYIGCIVIAPQPADGSLPLAYSNNGGNFSIRLAPDYRIDEEYRYRALGAGKDIYGVKFTVPSTMATGTNLSADSYLSVEGLPSVEPPGRECSASLFLERATAQVVTDGAMTYSVATSTGVGAGNQYEEVVFAIPGSNPCMAVRYYIHSTAFENYPAGTVRKFDAATLVSQFDAIRRTLVIGQ